MASRRVRIKGIANIPTRKKPGSIATDHPPHNEDVAINNSETKGNTLNLKSTAEPHGDEQLTQPRESKLTVNSTKTETPSAKSIETPAISEICNNRSSTSTSNPNVKVVVNHDDDTLPVTRTTGPETNVSNKPVANFNSAKIKYVDLQHEATSHSTEIGKSPGVKNDVRRRFLKPTISANVINRKPKEKIDELKEPNKENVHESTNVNLNETSIVANATGTSPVIQKVDVSAGQCPTKMVGCSKYKDNSAKSGSDTECTHPPTSPSKINRTRIKAVPRLNQRRASFSIGSASESEDDCRRSYSSRIRNDSVCSAASGINESQPVAEAASPVRKEYISVIQRKCKRTEQSRKLAEARREFNMKFNKGRPDKQKLTMIDLIFYNPATNPMSQKKKRKLSIDEDTCDTIISKVEKTDEEKADDPMVVSDAEDHGVPAPQIKIGPNGEIVVDEKSLVIENSQTKISRQALQDSEVVDGDFDTNYGVYKRVKRSKDWTKMETLRFYKALNTIGTDFTIMCELFPGRTRRELKMKFKKEERMNKALIDRAVMRPLDFDMTELRRDVEMEERKSAEMKKRKSDVERRKSVVEETGIEKVKGVNSKVAEINSTTTTKVKKYPKRQKAVSDYDAVRKGINGLLEDSDVDEDDNLEIKESKPTRKQKTNRNVAHSKPNENKEPGKNLEPGSIVIMSSKAPSGELMYKVFMVTDDGQNKQQIDLEPDLLRNLTKGTEEEKHANTKSIITISAQEQVPENNYTIDESVNRQSTEEIPVVKDVTNNCEISTDNIIFPFDECLNPEPIKQNVTIPHDENKMVVVMENN